MIFTMSPHLINVRSQRICAQFGFYVIYQLELECYAFPNLAVSLSDKTRFLS